MAWHPKEQGRVHIRGLNKVSVVTDAYLMPLRGDITIAVRGCIGIHTGALQVKISSAAAILIPRPRLTINPDFWPLLTATSTLQCCWGSPWPSLHNDFVIIMHGQTLSKSLLIALPFHYSWPHARHFCNTWPWRLWLWAVRHCCHHRWSVWIYSNM